jgi:hypothetical protein
MAEITGTGPAEMKLLAARLHDADPALKRELRRSMRTAAGPVVAAVRASILSMPSHHDGSLRAGTARTVSSSVGLTRTGARLDIVSAGRKMPAGEDRLPGFLDSAKGWSHPVFGNRDVWVRQHGKPAWFERPPAVAAPALRRAVQDAMDATARKLGH